MSMSTKLENINEKDLKNVLNGSSYAAFCAKNDREIYHEYKSGETEKLTVEEIKEMQALSVLEDLGYPLDELGTYLYKEVIAHARDEMDGYNRRKEEDKEKAQALLIDLEDAYSNFYHMIAREDLEMGIKSFHICIWRAVQEIDDSKIDRELAEKIFGKNPIPLTYGAQAFKIASYLSKKYMIKYDGAKVKKLLNVPYNDRLKVDQ